MSSHGTTTHPCLTEREAHLPLQVSFPLYLMKLVGP